ncbi:hypothetical protein T12_7315 [Trichinella patagoniensis]|uniref:Uncharacterized protein n=1 Tax=Trichinella patagoniensis TaxID=990121 RepID=A0A0V0YWF9_9BILA|nr:hypothetical protein T12_7315 [Trichinella patagoniensis]
MSLQFTASKTVPATRCKIQILHNKIQVHVQLSAVPTELNLQRVLMYRLRFLPKLFPRF